jgi:cytochrome c-type protein NapC
MTDDRSALSRAEGGGRKRTWTKRGVALGLFLFLAGMVSFLGFTHTLEQTNTTEFCTSCHSMQWVYKEYQQSVHYKNIAGVGATCADCHVPKPLGPKLHAKMMAAKDLYGEIMGTINTKEKFEAHRWEMANSVWDKMLANNSRECRNCHDIKAMNLEEQGRSARRQHENAEAKGETCIECHKGVAHVVPDEPEEEAAPEDTEAAAPPPAG